MFCRLCAQQQPHNIPIFSESSLNIDIILYNLFGIEVSREDVLPTVICLDCFRKTNTLNEYKASVQQAQEILKLLIISEPENIVEVKSFAESDPTIVTTSEIFDNEIQLIQVPVENVDNVDPESESNSSNEKVSRKRRDEFRNLLCSECDEIFRSAELLSNHFQIKHKMLVQFKCNYCSQIYKKYRSFTRHVETHIESKRFMCEICDRTFSQKCGLKNHLYSHIQDRTFECGECHLTFKQHSSLFNHRKVHTHVYSCDDCEKVFSSSLTLLQHKKAKHFNQKDRVCDVCNKGYASLSGLYYHKLSHNQESYVCSVCDRKFKTNSLLNRHMNVHKDISVQYTCELCGKSFKSNNSLILHKKIHNVSYEESVEYSNVVENSL